VPATSHRGGNGVIPPGENGEPGIVVSAPVVWLMEKASTPLFWVSERYRN
jgi:hypothetical protein